MFSFLLVVCETDRLGVRVGGYPGSSHMTTVAETCSIDVRESVRFAVARSMIAIPPRTNFCTTAAAAPLHVTGRRAPRKKYHFLQHSGAGIIVMGIILAKATGGGGGSAGNLVAFNAIFFAAVIPSAISSVFKEVAFKGFDGDLDVNVLQFWVAAFQFVTNFLAMPIYTLSVLGPQRVPLSEMPALITGPWQRQNPAEREPGGELGCVWVCSAGAAFVRHELPRVGGGAC